LRLALAAARARLAKAKLPERAMSWLTLRLQRFFTGMNARFITEAACFTDEGGVDRRRIVMGPTQR